MFSIRKWKKYKSNMKLKENFVTSCKSSKISFRDCMWLGMPRIRSQILMSCTDGCTIKSLRGRLSLPPRRKLIKLYQLLIPSDIINLHIYKYIIVLSSMEDKTILTLFAFGTIAVIFFTLYCMNRRW